MGGILCQVVNTETKKRFRDRFGKIGPNDKCPCNSGKKFKKCHGIYGEYALAVAIEEGAKKRDEEEKKIKEDTKCLINSDQC